MKTNIKNLFVTFILLHLSFFSAFSMRISEISPACCSVEDFNSFKSTLLKEQIAGIESVGAHKVDVTTSYGRISVTEPVLQELFFSYALLRTKDIHQYGFVRYIHPEVEEYSRYVHSVNVWALLRLCNASIEEQIAGLLHDVSHTAFSHVGDYVYAGKAQEGKAYQDFIHKNFLQEMGVEDILKRHNYKLEDLDQAFHMLEQRSPHLCADRIEYTLYAGKLNIDPEANKPFLSNSDVESIVWSLHFDTQTRRWYFDSIQKAYKFARVSLYTTEHVVGAAWNHIVYNWMADAVIEAFKCGELSEHSFKYSYDKEIWNTLRLSKNPIISQSIEKIMTYPTCFKLCSEKEDCDCIVHTKFRGINPLVRVEGRNGTTSYKLLTEVHSAYKKEYIRVEKLIKNGWRVKFIGKCAQEPQNIRDVIS